MRKISIVILNYLNYWDTIECIDSIFKMGYEIEGIVVVDNASQNESCKILKKRYSDNGKIIIVRAGQNYGFAKGNNIGISIARKKFHTDFVLVVNSDTIFQQKDYMQRLLGRYEHGVGIIGPGIRLGYGDIREEFWHDFSFRENLKYLCRICLRNRGKDLWSFLIPEDKPRKVEKILQGCALLFTPDFFKYYEGFYRRTFMYAEECFLYLMCKKRGLRQLYVHDAYIYHKVGRSSEIGFESNANIGNDYLRQSYKLVLLWIVADKVNDVINRLEGRQSKKAVYESTKGVYDGEL